MPSGAVDILLALNISFSALVLIAVLISKESLSVSSFPTLLLLTTLFRLSLNISSTRLILNEGYGGEVIKAFGEFVARSDLVTGLVLYALITLIQLMVISRGSERVAEVAARFTLDAMPGKQMSIDATLRAGSITEEEAEIRREDLSRQAQFYGAMDGAMKFIKGDVTLGLVITAINLGAGLIIGVFRQHMSVGESADVYATLTIGDGLVSQIPALLLALASGLVTTRVGNKTHQSSSLGAIIHTELLSNVKVLGLTSLFAAILGAAPGLPTVPFLLISGMLAALATVQSGFIPWRSNRFSSVKDSHATAERQLQAEAQRALSDSLAPTVHMLTIDIAADLSKALGFTQGTDHKTELITRWLPEVRDALYVQTGVKVPTVRVRAHVTTLSSNTSAIKVNDTPVSVVEIDPVKALVIPHGDHIESLGISTEAAENPLNGSPAVWVPLEYESQLSQIGLPVWGPSGVLSLHLLQVVQARLREFIGLQETAELVRQLEKLSPDLVQAVVPKPLSLALLRDILKLLVAEKVSIRDLRSIFEALVPTADASVDVLSLVEHVRVQLGPHIAHRLAGPHRQLAAATVDIGWEELMNDALVENEFGEKSVVLDPEIQSAFLQTVKGVLSPMIHSGLHPLVLTQQNLRIHIKRLLEKDLNLTVLAYSELPQDLVIHPVGTIRLELDKGVSNLNAKL